MHAIASLVALLSLTLSLPASGSTPPAAGETAAAAPATLQRAAGAVAGLTTLRYTFDYHGENAPARFTGRVELVRGDAPGQASFRLEGEIGGRPGDPIAPGRISLALVDGRVWLVDHRAQRFLHGDSAGAGAHLLTYMYYGIFTDLLSADPFAFERQLETTRLERRDAIGGREVDVVATNNPAGWSVWWSFDRETGLPIAQRVRNETPGQTGGGWTFAMDDIEIGVPVDAQTLRPEIPPGYEVVDEDSRPVVAGAKAPEVELRDAVGRPVMLGASSGDVIVLDFWASWCVPCWTVMDELEEIARAEASHPVRVFGVNIWENTAVDPAQFLAGRGVTYPQLGGAVEAAAMAFKVSYLPATFVIGPSGDILLAAIGGIADGGQSLREAIGRGLGQAADRLGPAAPGISSSELSEVNGSTVADGN